MQLLITVLLTKKLFHPSLPFWNIQFSAEIDHTAVGEASKAFWVVTPKSVKYWATDFDENHKVLEMLLLYFF